MIQNIQIIAAITKQEQHRNKVTKPQTILFQNVMKITQKKFDIEYTHVIQGSYNKEYKKTFAHIMSHF